MPGTALRPPHSEAEPAEPCCVTPACVIAVAASAGGVDALQAVVAALPDDFAAAVVILLHTTPHQPSLLPDILGRRTSHRVREAQDGTPLCAGTIYVAPAGRHLVFGADATVSLTQSDPVHFARPSADLLFASGSTAHGPRFIAVVLTGYGVDGAAGLPEVKRRGGTVIAQDEATSAHFGMPRAAIATGAVDLVLPLEDIAPALVRLVNGPAHGG